MQRLVLATAILLLPFLDYSARADEILVAAATSLTDVLKDLSGVYQAKSGNKLLLTLGASNFLARQIDEGAPADLFFSADIAQMEFLDRKGRLEPGTRKNLLSNQLVLIIPADSTLRIASPQDLLKSEMKKLALANPAAVPAGVYARKYLDDEGLWPQVKSKVIAVLDVRAALASVESGNVEAGFVYKTDAALSTKIKIVYEVPSAQGPKIVYPVAVVKDSRKKAAARDFAGFLESQAAGRLFKKYGFVILE